MNKAGTSVGVRDTGSEAKAMAKEGLQGQDQELHLQGQGQGHDPQGQGQDREHAILSSRGLETKDMALRTPNAG